MPVKLETVKIRVHAAGQVFEMEEGDSLAAQCLIRIPELRKPYERDLKTLPFEDAAEMAQRFEDWHPGLLDLPITCQVLSLHLYRVRPRGTGKYRRLVATRTF